MSQREIIKQKLKIYKVVLLNERTISSRNSRNNNRKGKKSRQCKHKTNKEIFGGGGGAGVTITPVAFLVISDGEVTIKHITAFDNAAERVVNLVPEMFDKVTSVVNKAKKEKEKAASNDAAEYVSAVPAEDVPSENK